VDSVVRIRLRSSARSGRATQEGGSACSSGEDPESPFSLSLLGGWGGDLAPSFALICHRLGQLSSSSEVESEAQCFVDFEHQPVGQSSAQLAKSVL